MTQKTVPFDQDRMTRAEAAEYLGLAETTLRDWASTGANDLPYHKLGAKKVYYRRSELDAWLETRKRTQSDF